MRYSLTTRRDGDKLLKLMNTKLFNVKVASTFPGLMGQNKCDHQIEDISNGRLLYLGFQAGLEIINNRDIMALEELRFNVGIDGFLFFRFTYDDHYYPFLLPQYLDVSRPWYDEV